MRISPVHRWARRCLGLGLGGRDDLDARMGPREG
jgi:hypothetical protein